MLGRYFDFDARAAPGSTATAPVSAVAPFALLWAFFFGYMLFGEIPDGDAVARLCPPTG